jgi:hypothetical protein
MQELSRLKKQKGVATLLIAVMLIIATTLVTFLTAKTVLQETKITANNYRTVQATSAASAAMDEATAYFMAGGLDQIGAFDADGNPIGDGSVDYAVGTPMAINLIIGAQTTRAQFYFDNDDDNLCDCQSDLSEDGDCMETVSSALMVAQGWSDDDSATRTVSQCVGTVNIFDGGDSPQQPFVSKAGVGVFGNAKIINRYSNISIWAGGDDSVHGASYGTYLRPSGTEIGDYSTEQLDSSCAATPCNVANNPGPNTQLVSNAASGNGIDVITNDNSLANATSSTAAADLGDADKNQFFDLFFSLTKAEVKQMAKNGGNLFPAGSSLDGKKGLIWVEGNININGTDVIGTPEELAILIIDGNLDKLNGATIYGIVYVTGTLEIAGNPIVKGSLVAENNLASTGAGTLTLVFKPWGKGENGDPAPFISGTGAIIAGSWKDW